MSRSKTKFAVALALFALAAPAFAQVPSYSPPVLQRPTFAAVHAALAVPQTGAGDAACLVGSATKIVYVTSVNVSGIKTTAQSAVMNLVKRTAANTGGTSTAATVGKMDSTSAAATAVLNGYTVVPTSGAGVTLLSSVIQFSAGTVGAGIAPQTFSFNPQNSLSQPVVLRGVAQSFCVNFPNAFTTDGPALDVGFSWTEQ